jgi:hypothetical protein
MASIGAFSRLIYVGLGRALVGQNKALPYTNHHTQLQLLIVSHYDCCIYVGEVGQKMEKLYTRAHKRKFKTCPTCPTCPTESRTKFVDGSIALLTELYFVGRGAGRPAARAILKTINRKPGGTIQ